MSAPAPRLTTQEVCDQTGIPRTKLKYWVQVLGLPVPKDGKGAWRWTPDLLEQLALVQQLREIDGRTLESVRRVIGEPADSPAARHGEDLDSPEADHGEPDGMNRGSHGEDLADALVPRLVEALTAQNDLGERYAKATYQIGKLEADAAHLRERAERAERELAEARQQLAVLTAPTTPARPWWKLW